VSGKYSQNVRTGEKLHLAISAFADTFASDPDVYISKTIQRPLNSKESDWYCEREGSDTCILHSDEFEKDDHLYITIACIDDCTYSLRSYYVDEYELDNNSRTTFSWIGHSTNILKYQIPSSADSAETKSISLDLVAEGDYRYIEVFMSHDSKFNVIEERPSTHILKDGVSVKLSSRDYQWCVNCWVYFIVNVIDDRRVYATATAHSRTRVLRDNIKTQVLINEGQTECLSFSVNATEDVICEVNNF